MAVDTAAKRRSMMSLALPWLKRLPPPGGSNMNTAAEREAMLRLYSGIGSAAGGGAVGTGLGQRIALKISIGL